MAGRYNITIDQGATFSIAIVWKDGAGSVIDLAAYSAAMKIRYDDGTEAISLSTGQGGGISISADDVITIVISSSQTAGLTAGSAVYDLELTTGSTVTRLIQGSVVISAEVTK